MKQVKLTMTEVSLGVKVGVQRQLNAIGRGWKVAHGMRNDDDGWKTHIEGAIGELAFCKAFKIYWPASVNVFKEADVGVFEIKTRSRHDWDLIVRPDTPDDRVCALVTGSSIARVYFMRGWMLAAEAKSGPAEWKQTYGDRDEAWFVPQAALHSWDEADPTWFQDILTKEMA